jgi:murein L,D-transpeptidase YafK
MFAAPAAYRRLTVRAMLILATGILAGCAEVAGTDAYRAYAPIPGDTLALMGEKGTSKDAPVLIRSYKQEAELEVWKQRADGRYTLLKTYPMCRWSGQLGPKVREGDRQVPEGFYTVTPASMNPNSAYDLSFNVGYPNAYDRALGRTGSAIMVHGICSSAGCFSMTNTQIEEIYAVIREAFAGGQRAIQMQSLPFRMTPANLAKHRLDPNAAFWRELKHGADHFEVTGRETPVGVCGRHYVFATAAAGDRLDPVAACPPMRDDAEVERAVSARDGRDLAEVVALEAKGVRPVRMVYRDGGQNPAFARQFAEVSQPEAAVAPPAELVIVAPQEAGPSSRQTPGVRPRGDSRP